MHGLNVTDKWLQLVVKQYLWHPLQLASWMLLPAIKKKDWNMHVETDFIEGISMLQKWKCQFIR